MMPIKALRMRFAAGGGIPTPLANPSTLSPNYKGSAISLSAGNLTASRPSGSNPAHIVGSIDAKTSGKFYVELTIVTRPSAGSIGLVLMDYQQSLIANPAGFSYPGVQCGDDGGVFVSGSLTNGAIPSLVAGDIICMAFDADAKTVQFRKNNGTWSATFSTASITGPVIFAVALHTSTAAATINFGGTSFAYPPPSGFAGVEKNAAYSGRHWRWRTYSGNVAAASIAEIELRESAGGADNTGTGSQTASSQFSATYSPAKAVDNNASTAWVTASGAGAVGWWQQDYGSGVSKANKEAYVTCRNDILEYSTQVSMVYSPDGTTFYPAMQVDALTWAQGSSKTFSLADG